MSDTENPTTMTCKLCRADDGGECSYCREERMEKEAANRPDARELAAIHALLDAHGVDRANRAEGNASRVYTLSERVLCVLRERDRAVQAEELLRISHKNAVERARKLGEHMDNIVGVM